MKTDLEIEENITVEEYNKLRKSISWNEHSEDMKGKEEFYEKCGFQKVPFEYTGYGMIRRIVK